MLFCTITFQFLIVANDSNLPEREADTLVSDFFRDELVNLGQSTKTIGCTIGTWFAHAIPEKIPEKI